MADETKEFSLNLTESHILVYLHHNPIGGLPLEIYFLQIFVKIQKQNFQFLQCLQIWSYE